MIRRMVIGLAVVASMVGTGPVGPARAKDTAQPPDLTGLWRLDAGRSDTMQHPRGGPGGVDGPRGMVAPRGRGGHGGMGGHGGRGGAGGARGPGGMGGGRGGRGAPPSDDAGGPVGARAGSRPVRLPDLIHVTHTESVVSIEDSTGTVLQEITTLGGAKDTLAHAPRAQVLAGGWQGEKLVVQRTGPGGGKATTTVAFEEKGDLLVIRTKLESSGDLPVREFKRAYRRVKD